jgi:hypothetical protein
MNDDNHASRNDDDHSSRIDWTVRLILILAPSAAIATALRPWATPPLAWGVATLLTMLAVYLIKPRPTFGFLKWGGLSIACALLASLLSLFLPGVGWKLLGRRSTIRAASMKRAALYLGTARLSSSSLPPVVTA